MIAAMILSFSAAAQTTGDEAGKRTAGKTQQKQKAQKAKSSRKKSSAKNNGVTTLSDEKTYKAKWTFEQMLMRRMEIDAEEGERNRKQREE